MHKILVVFGTRPEAIKLGPVISELRKHPNDVLPLICVTAQPLGKPVLVMRNVTERTEGIEAGTVKL